MRDANPQRATRLLTIENIESGACPPQPDIPPGIQLREFVSGRCGSTGLSTGTATFEAGAILPYHLHRFSEAVTILVGEAVMKVEGRQYRLYPLDCVHLPAGAAHEVTNPSRIGKMIAHWAFATNTPSRELVNETYALEDRGDGCQREGEPEFVMRFRNSRPYPLADGAQFYDLFAGRFGSVGICGGYGEFTPGSGLPCHTHSYDESITIVKGRATCQVAGRQYQLGDCDTAFVPRGRPHRFLHLAGETMAMIWVYAGSEPERVLVPAGYCDGAEIWPG